MKRLRTIIDTRTTRPADTCTAGIAPDEFRRVVDAGREAIGVLLSAGYTPERIASLAGKLIDQVVHEKPKPKRRRVRP